MIAIQKTIKYLGGFFQGLFRHGLWFAGMNYPVLLFQMGKVGSVTLRSSLEAAGKTVLHTHDFSENADARMIRKLIRQGRKGWKVITLVRDPVAYRISTVFQNLDNPESFFFVAPRECLRLLTHQEIADHAIEKILEYAPHPFDWFRTQLNDKFSVDVFSVPFDPSQGFQIYEGPLAKVLLIRYEDLWEKGKVALKAFLNMEEDFKWIPANLSSEKWYHDVYEYFKQQAILPGDFLKRLYDHPWTRHFYTEQEITLFKSR
ncbi:MAG: hypothetical protein JW893_01025 [Candidatus Omnitrophica bacterium]|nr:hypothetical protein [Candidatus Omnitrophota bacterium]